MIYLFPNFNIYSVPLLILFVWGLVFSALFLIRFLRFRHWSDLLIGAILLTHTYNRITYTIGFMAWYDTYPQTKINYFLLNTLFLLGPLIYFYVKSITQAKFTFRPVDIWHFIPMIFIVLYRLVMFIVDANQSGFDNVQNGWLFEQFHMKYFGSVLYSISNLSLGFYLLIAYQMYIRYRKSLNHLFANTHKKELTWLRNFLLVFAFLFLMMNVFSELDSSILSLSYKDFWWGQLAAALTMIYLGWQGYFSNIQGLLSEQEAAGALQIQAVDDDDSDQYPIRFEDIKQSMSIEKWYLNSSLTLADLAKHLNIQAHQISAILNKQASTNFNDFINQYRVEEVKQQIRSGKAKNYTLLTIAFDCGFNSKASFNRNFKKWHGSSPSDFLSKL